MEPTQSPQHSAGKPLGVPVPGAGNLWCSPVHRQSTRLTTHPRSPRKLPSLWTNYQSNSCVDQSTEETVWARASRLNILFYHFHRLRRLRVDSKGQDMSTYVMIFLCHFVLPLRLSISTAFCAIHHSNRAISRCPGGISNTNQAAGAIRMAGEELGGRMHHDVHTWNPALAVFFRQSGSDITGTGSMTQGEWFTNHWRHHGAVHRDENAIPQWFCETWH